MTKTEQQKVTKLPAEKINSTIKKVLGKKKSITATNTLSAKEMKKAVKTLKKNEIKPTDGNYHNPPLKPKKKKGQNLLRQKLLAKILAEDGGKTPIGKLMLKAGYKKEYANSPDKLKKTLSWEELMEKHFSDEKLAEVEGNQLHAAMIQNYVFSMALSDEEIAAVIAKTPGAILLKISHGATNNRAYFTTPDNASIGKSLDRIYKMKLKYPKDKSDNAVNERVDVALERLAKLLP